MRPGARRRAPFFALRLLPCRAPAGRRRGLGTGGGGGRKRGLCAGLQAEFTAEVERLAALAAGSLGTGRDLAAVELAIRTAMLGLGGSLLERLLAADTGHHGPRTDCGAGHQAGFVGYRDKTIDTVLGPVQVRRAYYHLSLIHISEPTRLGMISYAVFCLKKKKIYGE